MATKIEWTDETWNPVTGCTPISPGCDHCYAKRMANRLRGRFGYPADDPFRVTFHGAKIGQPWRWKKPRTVFICSMSDLFHDDVRTEWIHGVFSIVRLCETLGRRHKFLVLTKRPERMAEYFSRYYKRLSNLGLGVTAEDQQRADERIPILLKIPAAMRYVSLEPMLGEVDLRHYLSLSWVIAGGETGPGARPMHPNWVRSIRDQCQAAGVPFFFKGWGEWAPFIANGPLPRHCRYIGRDGAIRVGDLESATDVCMGRVGKKQAGRQLDGREWNEFPEWPRGSDG